MRLWKLTQGTVSTALAWCVERGFVVALPRQGTEPTGYVLSGTRLLIFPGAVSAKAARVGEGRATKRGRS